MLIDINDKVCCMLYSQPQLLHHGGHKNRISRLRHIVAWNVPIGGSPNLIFLDSERPLEAKRKNHTFRYRLALSGWAELVRKITLYCNCNCPSMDILHYEQKFTSISEKRMI